MGDALAEAFDGYVWTRWALGDDAPRARLTGLYRLFGRLGAAGGGTWLAEDGGRVLAAACWVRPDAPPPEPELAALLEREEPRLLGARAAPVRAAEAATAHLRPDPPYWFLAALGTVPAARGRGLGGALLDAGLAEVDRHGVAAALETSSEANVRLYARHGFAVAGEADPPGGAPHVWVMGRAPQRAQSTQVRAEGRAASRSAPIGRPQDSQTP